MIVLLFVLFSAAWATQPVPSAVVGYNCASPDANYTALDLTAVKECDPVPRGLVEEDKYGQIIQTRTMRPVQVYTCLIMVRKLITYCGAHSHASVVRGGFQENMVRISPSDCRSIHASGSYIYERLTFGDIPGNTTTRREGVTVGSLTESGTCHGAAYSDDGGTYTSVVVQVSVTITIRDYYGTAFLAESTIVLPRTGISCPLLRGYCYDDEHGLALWTLEDESACRTVELDVLHQGKIKITTVGASDKYAVVESDDKSFAFRIKEKSRLCGQSVSTTEHARVFVYLQESDTDYPWQKQGMSTASVDLTLHIGSKFMYVSHMVQINVLGLVKALLEKECETRRLVMENRIVLASESPDRVALLTDGPGFYGRLYGDVMYIVQCVPEYVSLRFTSRCYQEIPVLFGGKEMFLTPVTRLLVNEGNEVSCKSPLRPRFRIGDKWYTRSPELMAAEAPTQLDPNAPFAWTYSPIVAPSTGGLYSPEQLTALQKEMMFPNVREAVSTSIVRKVLGQSSTFETSSLWSSDDLDSFADTIAGRISWFFSILGRWASIFMGLYLIWKICMYLVSVILNCIVLRKSGRKSWHLCAGMMDVCTTIMTLHVALFQAHKAQAKPAPEDHDELIKVSVAPPQPPLSPSEMYKELQREAEKEMIALRQIPSYYPVAPPVSREPWI